MRNNITWSEIRLLSTVVVATATIVSSVVLTFSRLDYKLDMMAQAQASSDIVVSSMLKDIVEIKIGHATAMTRINNLETIVAPLLSQANRGGGGL